MNDFWMVFLTCWFSGLAFIVWIIRRNTESARRRPRLPPPPPPPSAVELLRQRYVRGEIGVEEFEQRLEVLHRNSLGAGGDGTVPAPDESRRR